LSPFDDVIAEIAAAAWFAACGEAPTAGEHDAARLYAAALGFAGVALSPVADSKEAATITQRSDWDRTWWAAEAKAAAECKSAAIQRYGAEPLLEGLSRVASAASGIAGAASMGLARGGVADQALARVASGSAAEACHQAALARAAEAPAGHAFIVKFQLFAAGRWPLGVVGGRLFVF
jgi:hypothetical protein